jgi:hypothetical protein
VGCNCGRKKAPTPSGSRQGVQYLVFRNNTYTGRSFTSLVNAEAYAARVGGEVRTSG